MPLELTLENMVSLVPFFVLVIDLLLIMIAVRIKKKVKRQIVVSFGIVAASIGALTILNSFLEYTLDPLHVLSHSMFSIILLFCAKLIVTEKDPLIFDRLVSLDLNTFDKFQYFLAQKMELIAGAVRRIQTGNLNFYMIFFLAGFITCLLLLLGFTID